MRSGRITDHQPKVADVLDIPGGELALVAAAQQRFHHSALSSLSLLANLSRWFSRRAISDPPRGQSTLRVQENVVDNELQSVVAEGE